MSLEIEGIKIVKVHFGQGIVRKALLDINGDVEHEVIVKYLEDDYEQEGVQPEAEA